MISLEQTHQPLYALYALLYSPCKVFDFFFFFSPSSAMVEAFTDIINHRLEVELLQNTGFAAS